MLMSTGSFSPDLRKRLRIEATARPAAEADVRRYGRRPLCSISWDMSRESEPAKGVGLPEGEHEAARGQEEDER